MISSTLSLNLGDLDPAMPGNSLAELVQEQNAVTAGTSPLLELPAPSATANVVLPIAVTTSGPNGYDLGTLAGPSPTFVANWSPVYQVVGNTLQLDTDSLEVTPFDWGELDAFSSLATDDFTSLLASAATFLTQVFDVGMFQDPLPLLKRGVDDLLEFPQLFTDLVASEPVSQLAGSPTARLNDLEAQLKAALDAAFEEIDSASSGGSGEAEPTSPFDGLSLSIIEEPGKAPVLRLDIPFNKTLLSESIPLNLDIPGVPSDLFQFGTEGTVSVTGGISMNLALGIDLNNHRPFLFDDGTFVSALLDVDGQDLRFEAGLGPLGVFIGSATQPGRVALDEDGLLVSSGDADGLGQSTAPASMSLVLLDGNGDNRHYFDELLTGDFDPQMKAALGVELPVFFPLEGQPLDASTPSLIVEITDLGDPAATTHTQVPDLGNIDFSQALDALLGGLDDLFRLLQDALDEGLFGKDLPLIGDKLQDASGFIDKLRQDLIDNLSGNPGSSGGSEGESPPKDVSFLQQAIFEAVGPGGLDWLQDQYSMDGSLTPDGLITPHDVRVLADGLDITNDLSLVTGNTESIEFDMRLGTDFFSVQEPFDLDLGVPALGLDISGQLDVTVGFSYDFSFGINKDEGPFFNVGDADELTVFFDVDIVNLETSAALALLNLEVAAMTPGELDYDARGNYLPSEFREMERSMLGNQQVINAFRGEFTVDMQDPSGEGTLTVGELGSALGLLDVDVAARATVHLNLLATLGGDTNFPSLAGELHLYWGFDTLDDFANATPEIEFRDIRLNMGELFSDLFGGALTEVQKVAQEVQPILDVLTEPIPVISDLAGSPVAL
ncbi:MAG TPA: hypothetical protein ENJ16_01860, partial [Planctomycetaceae bacterium]|nr:hypothetical protein [Planctomycetaceae bacterium]